MTAGQGPRECGWVVGQVVKALLREAQEFSLDACIIESLAFDKVLRNQSLVEPESFRSVLVKVEGNFACDFARRWEGSIKWQGESNRALKKGRPNHKRINWFVGVVQHKAPLNANSEEIHGKDLCFEAMRSSGAGGQHVNKTSSAVRLTHKPTGIKIRVDTDRSQHRNKQLAVERLKMILAENEQHQAKKDIRDRWLKHYQVERGNPVRTFMGETFLEKN